ncbi:Fc receptor-like protein 5 [Zonotrichia albicollis]|uniref:Fc receptor-like protein 5 n=1 Tax=Zonotrichia albicollis TaxID=44394 RepID=UPI003D80EB62
MRHLLCDKSPSSAYGDIPKHASVEGPLGLAIGWCLQDPPSPPDVTGPTCSPDWLVLQVPARPLLEGDRVTLRCRDRWNNLGHWVSFYHEEKHLVQLRNGTELTLFPLQLHHSGRYRCRGWLTDRQWVVSAPVTVTVHVPVANATITPSPLSHQVRAGDNLTLRCSVQVGSAPVTFTWLHNGQEVAQGPLLELRDIDVGHSGTYLCVATNQLGQDRHQVFQALSPELVLEVTPGSPWITGRITRCHQGVQDPWVDG